MTFAEKLRAARAAAGLTQAALAAASGRGLGAIRDYEQGNREPLLSTGVALARALGVPLADLVAGVAWEEKGLPGPARKPARGRPRKARAPAAAKAKGPKGRPRKRG